MILSFTQWLQATAFFTALRGSANAYPIVMALHMVGIAFFGGMILMTDMRLLGWSMRKHSIADVVNQFRVPKRWGLLLTATCGFLMFGSKAEEYYYNAFFRAKLALFVLVIVHELVFRRGVYAHPETLDQSPQIPGNAKLAAALSLVLWTSIACCGRGIGYIEPPLDKIHAFLISPAVTTLAAAHVPTERRLKEGR
ncbi:MAG TPA: DUF6644 family protein [Bryobacteraceae bacterium]|nr:DUF6644 family protein [Bryobacteraceae bacterium]